MALLDTALIVDELAHGTLVAPFGPTLDGLDYLLVHPAAAGGDPAVAALREWLRKLA